MIRLLIVAVTFTLSIPLTAQSECEFDDSFSWVQEILRDNYSGYKDKVNSSNQAEFDQFTKDYERKIANAKSDTSAYRLIKEWMGWFRDGHVQFGYNAPQGSPEEIRAAFADWERIAHTEESFRSWLMDNPGDQLQGIWSTNNDSYKVGIIKSPTPTRDYAAFILQADSVYWMPSQVKFELKMLSENSFTVNYFMLDHSLRQEQGSIDDLTLAFENLGGWYQQFPKKGSPAVAASSSTYSVSKLDKETLVLTVPTMSETVRKELIQLLNDNKDWMEQTPNWIIDCRGNGGGSDITYAPLLPYLATGDINYDHSKIYATEVNAQKYLQLRRNKNYPWYQRVYFGLLGKKLLRNQGEYIGKKCSSVQKTRRVKPIPEQVVILMDRGCGSSCESFVLTAEQSEKVTTMGQNSAGVSDYGNLHTVMGPCGKFQMSYPTSRYCRVDDGRGIDIIGISPDVEIAKDEDWIQIAHQRLTNQD